MIIDNSYKPRTTEEDFEYTIELFKKYESRFTNSEYNFLKSIQSTAKGLGVTKKQMEYFIHTVYTVFHRRKPKMYISKRIENENIKYLQEFQQCHKCICRNNLYPIKYEEDKTKN